MEKSESRMQYLEMYRRQLRRETDAMGYGQPKGDTQLIERQAQTSRRSSRAIVDVAVAVPG